MAEIVRNLSLIQTYPIYPMRELRQDSAREVYEAVGNYLDDKIMKEGQKIAPCAFLVRLDSGVEVAFEHGVARSSKENPNEIIFHN